MQIFVDGSVVTWSKDGQVISADNFKVLKDSRISVNHIPRDGVSITITDLKVSDSGQYACALNLKQNVLKVVHTLQIEGKILPIFRTFHFQLVFVCNSSQSFFNLMQKAQFKSTSFSFLF